MIVHKCEGKALDLVRAYRDRANEMAATHNRIMTEYQGKMQTEADAYKNDLEAIWVQLMTILGLPFDTTFGNPEFLLETRFVDDGFAAVVQEPVGPDPLQQALNAGPTLDKGKMH